MIDETKIKEIGELFWQRMNIPDPMNASATDMFRVVFLIELLKVTGMAAKVLKPSQLIETLRALADTIELVEQEGYVKE